MKNRIEEATNYETEIQNNPFILLEAIKSKMFRQIQTKYKYNQVTDTLLQFFSTKQEHGESLIDYSMGFKQAKDNVKLTLGTGFLYKFIENTNKYKNACKGEEQKAVLADSWDRWTAYMQLRQSNRNKYGSFLNYLDRQYALGFDEYPTNNTKMKDAMTRHMWDDKYFSVDKKIRDKARNTRESDRNNRNNENVTQIQGQTGQSLSQREQPDRKKKACFKCGQEGHRSPECPLGQIPKDDWWINKQSGVSAHQKARCMELA